MRKALQSLLILLFWLGIWQAASMLIGQELLIPAPLTVLHRLSALSQTTYFWRSIAATLLRVLAGYLLGIAAGSLLGALTWRFGFVRRLLHPLLLVVRSTPVSSFIILVLLWIATDLVPVFISLLMVLGIFWQNIFEGLDSLDHDLLEMAQVYRLSFSQRLHAIYLPSLRPFFSSAALASLGLAWKSGVAAEVLCHPKFSMGKALYDAKIYLETADLFAWTAMIVFLSMLLEKLVHHLLSPTAQKEIPTKI
jgi:NitT/TauT family transport system permease protein